MPDTCVVAYTTFRSLGGWKVGSAFYPSHVKQWSKWNSWELLVKNKLSLCKGSVSLRQLNPISIGLSTMNEVQSKKKAE